MTACSRPRTTLRRQATSVGVRAIAGSTLDARGRMLAVVPISNHADARNAQPVQDALLEWDCRRGFTEARRCRQCPFCCNPSEGLCDNS